MAELQPLEVTDIGYINKPFQHVTELQFPSPLPLSPYDDDIHRKDGSLLSVSLTFRDRPIGRLAIVAITGSHAREGNLKTPAGEVKYTREETYADGTSIEIVQEAPLIFAIGTATRSMRDYNELQKFRAILGINGIRYFLPVIDPFDGDHAQDHFRSTRSALICNSWDAYRQSGEPANFTIPGVSQVLRGVNVGFTQTS